jgi:hypothetical protein
LLELKFREDNDSVKDFCIQIPAIDAVRLELIPANFR